MWIALIVCSTLLAAFAMLLGFHFADQRNRRRTALIQELADAGRLSHEPLLAVLLGIDRLRGRRALKWAMEMELLRLGSHLDRAQAEELGVRADLDRLVDDRLRRRQREEVWRLRESLRAIGTPRRRL